MDLFVKKKMTMKACGMCFNGMSIFDVDKEKMVKPVKLEIVADCKVEESKMGRRMVKVPMLSGWGCKAK